MSGEQGEQDVRANQTNGCPPFVIPANAGIHEGSPGPMLPAGRAAQAKRHI
jgi:hypothetical protein